MINEDNYPDELIRGISSDNEQFVSPEGYPTAAAFKFDEYDPSIRDDGFCELSINWIDDEGAIDLLLNQINERKNMPQFQGGYCRFQRLDINYFFSSQIEKNYLSYERKPIVAVSKKGAQANKYHGNILLKSDLSKAVKTNIQATLATLAGTVIRRNS